MSAEELIEQLRWRKEEYGFGSVELWEGRRREKWVRPDARKYQVDAAAGRMSREVRTEGPIQVADDDAATVALLIEGRTVVKFERTPNSGVDWSQGENSVTLTLDDGSQLEFWGWGYDASGCETTYVPPVGVAGTEKEQR